MKTILITGAAQGIGQSMAELFLEDAANKIIVIDKQKTVFIDACIQKYPDCFDFYLQDIADREGLSKVLQLVAAKPLHGIVNNAGEVYLEKWDNISFTTWNRTLAVNVTGPLQIVHELRNSLSEESSIINIASTDGFSAAYDTIAYAASKAALINVTQSLAAILGEKGVRVNAVAPGWVETEMTKDTLPEQATYMTPLHRNAQAHEVAQVVEFLLSDKSRFINGETIIVDGGLSAVDYTIKKESENNPA